MQLLYPIGLLAFAGLIIPVIIHLWSVKKGKTLKIGSINLLGESASATSKSLKITDWLLFIMRCLLLAIVAFILAQPLIQQKIFSKNNKGWILIDQNQFSAIYPKHQKSIDSLLNLGFELHDFNFGFQQYELKDSAQKVQQVSLSYNSLLKKLNSTIPNGAKAYLFAPKRQIDLEGELPTLNYQLNWKETIPKDSLKTWTTNFIGKDYEAKSSPSLTTYKSKEVQDLATITVMIHEPKGNDSKYIKAGLRTIADFTKRKIEIKTYTSELQADLIFWLSEQAIPSSYLAKLKPKSKVFSYTIGKVNVTNSTLQFSNSISSQIALYKRIDVKKPQGEIIWRDGFGEALLIKQQNNQISRFYFYSRFNPQWTDLVWNDQFVNLLIPIVLGDQNAIGFGFEQNENDQRLFSANQNLLINGNESNTVATRFENIALAKYLWILALLILGIERFLSFRKTKISHVKS